MPFVAQRFTSRESAWLRFASFITKENVHDMLEHMEPDFHAGVSRTVEEAANALDVVAAKMRKVKESKVRKRKNTDRVVGLEHRPPTREDHAPRGHGVLDQETS